MADLEVVCDQACVIGENPLWHAEERKLYFTDIDGRKLYRTDEAGACETIFEGRKVGGFTIQGDGSLLLFMDRGTIAVWSNGAVAQTIVEEIENELDSRFNDVIADPAGRVFCGTMSLRDEAGNITRPGRWYRLDLDGSLTQLRNDVLTSNGMGFSPDRTKLYYTDTRAHVIWRYDYDSATGEVSNGEPFIEVAQTADEGRPDGMTVAAAGELWSARWDGSRIVKYTPDGQASATIEIPEVKKVSCVTFGGDDLHDLYVTTAGGRDKANEGANAGALLRIKNAGQGVPEFRSRIGLT